MDTPASLPQHRFLAALVAGGLLAFPAGAAPVVTPQRPDGIVETVAGDCYAVGQQVAAENGGTLAKASASKRGDRDVCVIVVLVPGKDGQRPRRAEIVVPN